MFELDENEVVKVLTRNAIKCLGCNTVLESKYRHNFVECGCENQTFIDGGLVYTRVGAVDLDLVEDLCEHVEMTRGDHYKQLEQQKLAEQVKLQERIDKGEMKFLLGQWVSQSTYDLFTLKYPEYKE